LDFDGTNDALLASNFVLSNTHSIFAVAHSEANGTRYLLRSATYYGFGIRESTNDHFTTFYGNGSWHEYATNTPASSIGSTSVLGVLSDGNNATPYHNGTALNTKPSNMGNSVPAGISIGKRPDDTGYWDGPVAEIIIFNSTLSTMERQKIEGYLAHKWGLSGNLPSNHPYKLAHPLSTGSPAFITDTPFGDGKAIDLADGHVEISTGGNEDVFDGNGSFSVSAWVKGWPDEEKESIISKGYAIPKLESNPNMKLWLDAADTSSLLSRVKPNEVTISGPSSGNSQSFTRIFDGDWSNNNRFFRDLLPNNAFIEWTFSNSNSFRVTKYRLKHKHNVNHPKAFILSGSNDNTNWTEVDNRSSVTWSTTQDEIKSFTVQNPGYYSYYKLNFKERTTSGGSWVEIREIDLIGSYTTPRSASIGEWKDKSGNGNHASASPGEEPSTGTRSINSLNTLDFDGTNDALLASNFVLSNTHSIFVVALSEGTDFSKTINLNYNFKQLLFFGSWSRY
jgi:hypothetical protein